MSTMNSSPLRLGIIGFGRHAQSVFLPALQSSTKAQLQAIASTQATELVAATSGLEATEILNTYQQIIEKNDLDAVYIALPNHLHAEWTTNCLNAGLHVLCEKPIALSLEQEQQIDAASRASNKIVVEGFAYRFHPQHQLVKDIIHSGEIGEVTGITAQYSYFLDEVDNIRLKAECGGGAVYDVGCYLLDLCRFLFGATVSAISASSLTYNGVDAITSAHILLANGIAAALVCGCRSQRSNFYEVCGSKGKIRVCDAFHVPRNKAPRIELSLRNNPTTAISAVKFNQTLGLIEYFCDATNDNIAATLGITSNGFALESIKSLSK